MCVHLQIVVLSTNIVRSVFAVIYPDAVILANLNAVADIVTSVCQFNGVSVGVSLNNWQYLLHQVLIIRCRILVFCL